MKKTKIGYIITVFALALLVCSSFVGASLASVSFNDLVDQLSSADTWGEKSQLIEKIDTMYQKFDDNDKAIYANVYAEVTEQKKELASIENSAKRFILYIDSLADLSDLDEKEEAASLAMSEGVYFDDATYPGIEDALATLKEFCETVESTTEACIAFMDAVDQALLADKDDYSSLKSALTEAALYYDKIDFTYDGIREAAGTYGLLSNELATREAYTEEFYTAVAKLSDKTDYKSYLALYNNAKEYMSHESFIEDHPGVEDAKRALEEADAYIKECLTKANVFISIVSRFGSSEDIAKDLISAYKALEDVDLTVSGAATAKSVFDSTLKTYNDIANAIIADMEIL